MLARLRKFVFYPFIAAWFLTACAGPAIQIAPPASATPAGYPPPPPAASPYAPPTESAPMSAPTPTAVVPSPAVTASTPAQSGEQVAFNTLHMVTPQTGWALGEPLSAVDSGSGYPATQSIYHTTNGGNQWQDVSPLNVKLNAMAQAYFASAKDAWLINSFALGGDAFEIEVYRTTDAGQNWQRSAPFQTKEGMPGYTTFAPDLQHGWMVVTTGPGAGSEGLALYATSDGGKTWQSIMRTDGNGASGSLPTGCLKTGFTRLDASLGWASGVCYGGPIFFFVTHDGGVTWSRVDLPPPQGAPASLFQQCQCNLTPPVFVDPNTAFLSIVVFEGDSPSAYVYKTPDAGQTWLPYRLPVNMFRMAPDFATSQDGWVVGDNNQLFASSDSGQTWQAIGVLPVENVMTGLNFVDSKTGFLTDGTHVFITQNGGANWSSIQPAATYAPGQVNSP